MTDEAIRAALYRSLASGRWIARDEKRPGVRFLDGACRLFASDAQVERVLDEIGRFRTIIESEPPNGNERFGSG